MTRLIALTALCLVGVVTITIAQAQPDPTAIRIEKVKENLYVITGGRAAGVAGNTTVFVTTNGVVLVDTKYGGFGASILEQVASVTPKPVVMVINTHSHGDHTGGNPEFPRSVEFVSHENTRTNMARMKEFSGANAAVLPTKTYKDRLTLFGGRDTIELYHFGAGHTNGDTVIVFPSLQTAVMGDLFARKWAPLIDASNGGSAVAYPQTLARAVAGIKNTQTVITGHATTTLGSGSNVSFVRSNPIMTWADLREYADFIREFMAAANAARKAGKSVDDAVNGLKLPDRYRDYNMANARADIQALYDESNRNR
jgi:glyoxylase-like metal-dependent hydrolase (beta-lactamase superfamily II)